MVNFGPLFQRPRKTSTGWSRPYEKGWEAAFGKAGSATALLTTPGRIAPADIIKHLKGLSFADKVRKFRSLVAEARKANPTFTAQEFVGKNAEVVFMGAGKYTKEGKILKNVLVISRDGKVRVMTLDGVKRLTEVGQLPRIVELDFVKGSAEVLIP